MSKFAIHAPFVRNPYNYDTMAASDESGLKCEDHSLTSQSFRDESDINFIMDRFTRTGQLPESHTAPSYGDFTAATDYHTALNNIKAAQNGFMALPANIRSQFDNDPAKLIGFMENPANRDEAEKLGIINKRTPASQEGLSTPSSQPHTRGSEEEGVGKAGKAKASQRPSKSDSDE